MATDVVVHENPIWRERANFIIAASILDVRPVARWHWEQLWARQTDENRFEICCIPFFVYDLALGDKVETETIGEKKYVLNRVISQSGRYTFRAWFSGPSGRAEIIEEVTKLGCLTEQRWPSSGLLAIDAATDEMAVAVANLLHKREVAGQLNYETGRTK
jgi:hypothetical protein